MRRVISYLALGALVPAMIAARVFVGGWQENAKATDALAAGDVTEAITAYDRSLHWYLPGSPTVKTAAGALIEIARKAEYDGDVETALRAWRVLRSGFYGSRWLVTPGRGVIDEADRNIARLVSAKAEAATPGAGAAAFDREMAVLTKPSGPHQGWAMLAVLGFFGWVACAIGFIVKAFGPTDEFHRRPALAWGACFLAAYALWLIALGRA